MAFSTSPASTAATKGAVAATSSVGVLLEVLAVVGDRRFGFGARPAACSPAGHGQRAVFFGAAVAAQRVFALLQGQREAAGEAVGEVLHLAQDRFAVEHLELGDAGGAGVFHFEVDRARRRLRVVRVAAGVGQLEAHLLGAGGRVVAGAAAGGEQRDQADGQCGQREADGESIHRWSAPSVDSDEKVRAP